METIAISQANWRLESLKYLHQSKKSPTGPTEERTPKKPEYLITRSHLNGVRWDSVLFNVECHDCHVLGAMKVSVHINQTTGGKKSPPIFDLEYDLI